MNLLRKSLFFESQRRGRWRWPWLLLGILLGALAAIITGIGFFWSFKILGELMEYSWVKDFLLDY